MHPLPCHQCRPWLQKKELDPWAVLKVPSEDLRHLHPKSKLLCPKKEDYCDGILEYFRDIRRSFRGADSSKCVYIPLDHFQPSWHIHSRLTAGQNLPFQRFGSAGTRTVY